MERNIFGQLGRGFITTNEYFKPEIITYLKNSKISQLSCGFFHCLALTSEGIIYGWGNNRFGQIGCGQELGNYISIPTNLKTFTKSLIKSIYCSDI